MTRYVNKEFIHSTSSLYTILGIIINTLIAMIIIDDRRYFLIK